MEDKIFQQAVRTELEQVYEADLRGFFDAIDQGWMLNFLKHRVADRRILRAGREGSRSGGKRTANG